MNLGSDGCLLPKFCFTRSNKRLPNVSFSKISTLLLRISGGPQCSPSSDLSGVFFYGSIMMASRRASLPISSIKSTQRNSKKLPNLKRKTRTMGTYWDPHREPHLGQPSSTQRSSKDLLNPKKKTRPMDLFLDPQWELYLGQTSRTQHLDRLRDQ